MNQSCDAIEALVQQVSVSCVQTTRVLESQCETRSGIEALVLLFPFCFANRPTNAPEEKSRLFSTAAASA
jgi:hypothetical protein